MFQNSKNSQPDTSVNHRRQQLKNPNQSYNHHPNSQINMHVQDQLHVANDAANEYARKTSIKSKASEVGKAVGSKPTKHSTPITSLFSKGKFFQQVSNTRASNNRQQNVSGMSVGSKANMNALSQYGNGQQNNNNMSS